MSRRKDHVAVGDAETATRPVLGGLTKVLELIRRIRVALLATVSEEGAFHTRPVQTLAVDEAGRLWFFTDVWSCKADELRADTRVSLGYADIAARHYVAVSGMGTVRRDPHKAQELWQIEQRAFYPRGPKDKRLGVLRVDIERAEYWLAPGRRSYLYAAGHAAKTGEPARVIGINERVQRDKQSY